MNLARIFQRVYIPLTKNSVAVNLSKQTVACYSVKNQHRRPVKLYSADSETELNVDGTPARIVRKTSNYDDIQGVIELDKQLPTKNKKGRLGSAVDLEKPEENETYSESDNEEMIGTQFFRLGDTDRTFDRKMVKVQSKKQREKSNLIMLEGKRLIQDAITAGIIPFEIFFTRKSLVEELSMPPGEIKLFKMPYNKMKKWSQLETPPGIIAFCEMPKKLQPKPKYAIPLTLICDNIREPGNMGTILRTVAGVGCFKVILTKGCVDVWDTKVLRSGAGAHFYVPIEAGLTWEDINKQLDKNSSIFIAHHNEENETIAAHSVPTVPYFSIDYSCLPDIVVIVGGETEGISDEAVQMARYRDGLKINIPLNNNIDSLNVGAAVSTVLFEIKRQFIVNKADNNYLDNYGINYKNSNQNENFVVNR